MKPCQIISLLNAISSYLRYIESITYNKKDSVLPLSATIYCKAIHLSSATSFINILSATDSVVILVFLPYDTLINFILVIEDIIVIT